MKFIVLGILVLSGIANAGDCHYSNVTAIQSQSGNVLIQLKNSIGDKHWKSIGRHDDESTKSYQSIAQHAMATDYRVMLRFSAGHNCNATDYAEVPLAFRILK